MGIKAEKILYNIVVQYGREIYNEPGRLKAILRDYHIDKLQVNLLIEISKASYFRTFVINVNSSNIDIEKKMLEKSVKDDYEFEESYVRWGVDCWAQAFCRQLLNKNKIDRYLTDAPDTVLSNESTATLSLGHLQKTLNSPEPISTIKIIDEHNDRVTTLDLPVVSSEPTINSEPSKETENEKDMFTKAASLLLNEAINEQDRLRKTLERAEDGDANYRFILGEMYELGKGVNPNFRKALKWYKLSALQGNVHAMFRLGQIYEHGKYLPINYEEALRWYKAAKDNGYEHAITKYKQIKRRLRGFFL